MINQSFKKRLKAAEEERLLRNTQSNSNRAMSVTVGTAFGGTTEITMRDDCGRSTWCQMQPVEVIELVHQLAASVGCHITINPRTDFASWREWRVTEQEKLHSNGHAPFGNDMAPYNQVGAKGMDPEIEQALLNKAQLVEVGGGAAGRGDKKGSGGANVFLMPEEQQQLNKKITRSKK